MTQIEPSFQVLLPDPDSMRAFGRLLAETIDNRAVIALVGPLGAGKTALVKAVGSALGVKEIVNSPTFTMLNEYHSGRLPLYHMDLYRLLEDKVPAPLDLLLAEIEEFIDDDMIAMIEWAELFPWQAGSEVQTALLPNFDHITIQLDYADTSVKDTLLIGMAPGQSLERETAQRLEREAIQSSEGIAGPGAGPVRSAKEVRSAKNAVHSLKAEADQSAEGEAQTGRLATVSASGVESASIVANFHRAVEQQFRLDDR
jgi:tRNA threonylcarbamoyladenosine biosynthesis protein TsaE